MHNANDLRAGWLVQSRTASGAKTHKHIWRLFHWSRGCVAPDASTWPNNKQTRAHTHTHKSIPCWNNHNYIQSLSVTTTPYTHKNAHTHTHKHTPMPPTLTRINTSQLTWTYPQHVWGPHNSAVFTGTAGPLRQAGCVSVHTPVPSTRRNDPHASPGGTQRDTPAWLTTWCEYHLAWPDWLQLAANRQCGGGQ